MTASSDEDQQRLGQLLATRRRARGLSQAELARAIPYERSTLAHAERGKQIPSAQFWTACDKALDAGGALFEQYDAWRQAKARRAADAATRERFSQWDRLQGLQAGEEPGSDRSPALAALHVLGLHQTELVSYRHASRHSLYRGSATPHPDNVRGLIAASGIGDSPGDLHEASEPDLAGDASRDLALIGSPIAEALSASVFGYRSDGDPDSLILDNSPVDLPYLWTISRASIDEGATVRRYVAGRGLVERPNWRIAGPNRLYIPRTDDAGFLVEDFLLITKLRNYTSRRAVDLGHYILSFAGTHGTGTRAIELLYRNERLLSRLGEQLASHPAAFQLLLRVGGIRHDPVLGSHATTIEVVESPIVLPDNDSVWSTAVQIASQTDQ